jgi:hypothetical protein
MKWFAVNFRLMDDPEGARDSRDETGKFAPAAAAKCDVHTFETISRRQTETSRSPFPANATMPFAQSTAAAFRRPGRGRALAFA